MKRVCLLVGGLLLSGAAMADGCDSAATQADMNQCYAAEYKKQDERLNKEVITGSIKPYVRGESGQ